MQEFNAVLDLLAMLASDFRMGGLFVLLVMAAVSDVRSDARLKDEECLPRTKLPCSAAPEEPSEPMEQSRLEIVPPGSLPTDAPIGREAKTNCATTP